MTSSQGDELGAKDADDRGQGLIPIPFKRGGTYVQPNIHRNHGLTLFLRQTDMAGAALFFASPASYYITGQILNVDGGFVATNPATSA